MTEKGSRGAREPQSLEAWESWVDTLIVEAQERGDFDNLPGHGKPLKIDDALFAEGREVGFGMLKNAGVAPYWIELEKEIRAKNDAMEAMIARAASLAAERTPPAAPDAYEPVRLRWWWPFGKRERIRLEPKPAIDRSSMEVARIRREYSRLAGELERAIGQYNAAIPRELWQLERPRQSAEDAARAFDEAVAQRPA